MFVKNEFKTVALPFTAVLAVVLGSSITFQNTVKKDYMLAQSDEVSLLAQAEKIQNELDNIYGVSPSDSVDVTLGVSTDTVANKTTEVVPDTNPKPAAAVPKNPAPVVLAQNQNTTQTQTVAAAQAAAEAARIKVAQEALAAKQAADAQALAKAKATAQAQALADARAAAAAAKAKARTSRAS